MAAATSEAIAVRVPTEAQFDGADYLESEALEDLFVEVVGSYERLALIDDHDIRVRVLWKRKGGRSHGGAVLGKCVKAGGLVRHFGQAAFVIWLAADHLEEAEYTTAELRKLLYHEARHIGWEQPSETAEDGEGRPVLVGHDAELFLGEVEDTGADWERFRRLLAAEFRAPCLFGDDGDTP